MMNAYASICALSLRRSFISRHDVCLSLRRRAITTSSAKQVLGLTDVEKFTPKQLRTAYLMAAKKSHPDVLAKTSNGEKSEKNRIDAAKQFRLVTEAYECLQQQELKYKTFHEDVDYGITDHEEMEFRRACREWLGLTAEVVEESKRCPSFRQWLQGKTDAAFHWRMFFVHYGGLAPMLRKKAHVTGQLPENSTNRRKRPARSPR